jgi:23S rRNA (guanine745-N1)-methyltransferase
MYSRVVACLRCPFCHGGLVEAIAGSGLALHCASGHSFDIAKQGYVNLASTPPAYQGDTAQMVEARVHFLGAGHYGFIANAVAGLAASICEPDREGLVVEAGAGTGYYLTAVLDALPGCYGLALDVSKAALRRAAKAHPHCGAALCDVWHELPVADAAARLVLSIFAPRNGPEFRRVLAVDGELIVVTPTSFHLTELVGPLELLSVDPNKDKAVAASLGDRFQRVGNERHSISLHLSHQEVTELVGMGPSAWHVDAGKLETRIGELPESVKVTASVDISTYRAQGSNLVTRNEEPARLNADVDAAR